MRIFFPSSVSARYERLLLSELKQWAARERGFCAHRQTQAGFR